MSSAEQARAVGALDVIGLPLAAAGDAPRPRRRGERALPKAVLRALAAGPVTIAELEPDASRRVALLRRLMADRVAHPVTQGAIPAGPDDPTARLNKVVGRAPTPARDRIVVSPLIASAVAASPRPAREDLTRLGVR